MTEPVKNLHQRLHAVMAKVEYIQKEEKKPGIQYRFVSHDAVTAKVRPVLVKEGIIYYPQNMKTSCDGNKTIAEFDVRFANIDDPSDYIDVPTFGYGIDNQDKGPGKAISYGVKYALLKALGLETGDDPERDNIDHQPAPIKRATRPTLTEWFDTLNRDVSAAAAANDVDGLRAILAREDVRRAVEKLADANADRLHDILVPARQALSRLQPDFMAAE